MEATGNSFPVLVSKPKAQQITEEQALQHFQQELKKLSPVLGRHCLLYVYDSNIRKLLFDADLKIVPNTEVRYPGMNSSTWSAIRCDAKLFQYYCEQVLVPTIERDFGDFMIKTTEKLTEANDSDRDAYMLIQTYVALLGGKEEGASFRKMLIELHKIFNSVWMTIFHKNRCNLQTSDTLLQTYTLAQISDSLVRSFRITLSGLITGKLLQTEVSKLQPYEIGLLGAGEVLNILGTMFLGPTVGTALLGLSTCYNLKTTFKLYANSFTLGFSKHKNIHSKVQSIAEKSHVLLPELTDKVLNPLQKKLLHVLDDVLKGEWGIWNTRFTAFLQKTNSCAPLAECLEVFAPAQLQHTVYESDPEWTVLDWEGEDEQREVFTKPLFED
jgi:hypothetical protein